MGIRLQLESLHVRHRGLTASLAGCYCEAASVCLSRHHGPPTEFSLSDNGTETNAEVAWVEPDNRTTSAWANHIDTTEIGAYGCVLAAIESLRGFFAVRRAEHGSGADYYVGPLGAGETDLEDCVRLEVSGLDKGDPREVVQRLLEKVQQARDGQSSLPAVAGVVGFRSKLLMLRDVGVVNDVG